MSEPLLQIRDPSVSYPHGHGHAQILRRVSFDVHAGECLAVVGESGSGKTQAFLACMGLLPTAAVVQGSIRFQAQELLGASERQLRGIRGEKLAMVFQDPMSALTPHLRVGDQLIEGLRARAKVSRRESLERALHMLERVQVPDPRSRLRQYPHELSGGMRQRVLIAMALLMSPHLLIADEPTTALDVSVQAQIIDVMRELRATGQTLVLITHDLGVVAALADRVVVMRAGEVVETAAAQSLFANPRERYTRDLLAAVPRLNPANR